VRPCGGGETAAIHCQDQGVDLGCSPPSVLVRQVACGSFDDGQGHNLRSAYLSRDEHLKGAFVSFLSKIFFRTKEEIAPAIPSAAAANRRDILVVDDDPHLRELVRFALEQKGYAVRVGGTGADAIRMAQESTPDLIILDGNMPVMDGLDALKKLRTIKNTEKVPVIMLTMRSHQVDMISGYRFGAQEYLTKPIAIEQLMVSVRKLLGSR
jgi:CheY-like chemotaxis protein